jgi:hypothetical protein
MKVWDDNNTLTKRELASLYEEVGNAVESTGQTLDSSGSTIMDSDTEQLARAMSYAGGGASMMTATGGATDVITLTPVNTSLLLPESYALLDGFTARFYIGTQRTVPYQININSLGAKGIIKDIGGVTLSVGDIPVNKIIEVVYLHSHFGGKWVLTEATVNSIYTNQTAVLQYKTTGSTNGILTTPDTWTKYPFQTIQYSDINGLSLSSNEITLPAGKYSIESLIHFGSRWEHSLLGVSRLITDGGTEKIRGISIYEKWAKHEKPSINVPLVGILDVVASGTYLLQYYTNLTSYLGLAIAPDGTNVYGTMKITRLR